MTDLHVGFVVPRYGVEVVGGAEFGARQLAEHLAADGCTVEVFTTRALESTTWANHFDEGTAEIAGVAVHRFSGSERVPDFDARSAAVLRNPTRTSLTDAERWLEWQGPVCHDAVEAAVASQADVVVNYPYLYWPIIETVRRLGRKAVLQPAAHDEAAIRLAPFRSMFPSAGGLVFQTEAERRLTERLFPTVSALPQAAIGLGIEMGAGSEGDARRALGIGERPYVLSLGRVDDLKGTTFLAEWFAAYKQRRPGPLVLVLAGPVSSRPLTHPDVIVAGAVPETIKWGAIAGSEIFVSPSFFEAFSLVLMEAWSLGRPVLVNGRCAATTEHCRRSGGGWAFERYAQFETMLDRLVTSPALRATLGENGRRYMQRHFTWPGLTARYRKFLESVATLAAVGSI